MYVSKVVIINFHTKWNNEKLILYSHYENSLRIKDVAENKFNYNYGYFNVFIFINLDYLRSVGVV